MKLPSRSAIPLALVLLLGLGWGPSCRRSSRGTTIRVSGAWALYPAMVRWAEVYQQTHPGIRIDVAAGGAGKGMTDCLGGLVDLGMVSRDLRPEELQKGILPLPVAKDAVFATVNAGNPALPGLLDRGLSRAALVDLWIKGRSVSWESLAPGGRGEVRVFTRSDACGAAETWAQYLGGRQEDLKGIALYGDPGLAEGVRQTTESLGYNNLNFAFDPRTNLPVKGLAVVPLDANGNGRVDPSEDLSTRTKALAAIRSGAYPAPPARDLFLVVRKPVPPAVQAFLVWILSDGQQLADEVGYVPITEAQRSAALGRVGP